MGSKILLFSRSTGSILNTKYADISCYGMLQDKKVCFISISSCSFTFSFFFWHFFCLLCVFKRLPWNPSDRCFCLFKAYSLITFNLLTGISWSSLLPTLRFALWIFFSVYIYTKNLMCRILVFFSSPIVLWRGTFFYREGLGFLNWKLPCIFVPYIVL